MGVWQDALANPAATTELHFRFGETQRALELGKSPAQFVADSDFEAFVEDPAFVALLDAHR